MRSMLLLLWLFALFWFESHEVMAVACQVAEIVGLDCHCSQEDLQCLLKKLLVVTAVHHQPDDGWMQCFSKTLDHP